MKHLKTYEQNNEPQVGDYVLCREEFITSNASRFVEDNIGQIYKINPSDSSDYPYVIKFENVPKELDFFYSDNEQKLYNCRGVNRFEIAYWSKNKEDLEIILSQKKYNL